MVIKFYEDNEYSRMMPGKKDSVSISKNIHVQKRLIKFNELYQQFKIKYPHQKIGFSKFCSLRPKWCVLINSAGKNAVDTLKMKHIYKDLMKLIVFSTENAECMLHRCEYCPGLNALQSFLDNEIQDMDKDEDIFFQQWQSTDRTTFDKLFRYHIAQQLSSLRWDYFDEELFNRYIRGSASQVTCYNCYNFGHISPNCPAHTNSPVTNNSPPNPSSNFINSMPPFRDVSAAIAKEVSRGHTSGHCVNLFLCYTALH